MRIIRFLGEDGRIHHGREHADRTATVLLDLQGVLGAASPSHQPDLFRGKHALVADDDENMRRLMASVLRKAGCVCTLCADGAEAVSAIDSQPLDLIVSDIIMPHGNGYEIFAAAKQRRRNMPVVLVTGFGYDPNHSLVRAATEGFVAVLYKPFTPQDLLDEFERAIRAETTDPIDALVRTDQRLHVRRLLAPLEPTAVVRVRVGPDGICPTRRSGACIVAHEEALALPSPDGVPAPAMVIAALALVIGRSAADLPEAKAQRCVLGYCIASELMPAEGAAGELPCALGPAIVSKAFLEDGSELTVRTSINGREVDRWSAHGLPMSLGRIVAAVSSQIPLESGMVLLIEDASGKQRPASARAVRPADEIAVEITGLGRLTNRVEAEDT